MIISARVDYAVRAMLVLAAAETKADRAGNVCSPVSADAVAAAQDLPRTFLDPIFRDLRQARLVTSVRGPFGGYRLARPAAEITLGEVFRAVGGPLSGVHGLRPHETAYEDAAAALPTVWVAVRAAVREVLDEVTLQRIVDSDLPEHVRALAELPDAWQDR